MTQKKRTVYIRSLEEKIISMDMEDENAANRQKYIILYSYLIPYTYRLFTSPSLTWFEAQVSQTRLDAFPLSFCHCTLCHSKSKICNLVIFIMYYCHFYGRTGSLLTTAHADKVGAMLLLEHLTNKQCRHVGWARETDHGSQQF